MFHFNQGDIYRVSFCSTLFGKDGEQKGLAMDEESVMVLDPLYIHDGESLKDENNLYVNALHPRLGKVKIFIFDLTDQEGEQVLSEELLCEESVWRSVYKHLI